MIYKEFEEQLLSLQLFARLYNKAILYHSFILLSSHLILRRSEWLKSMFASFTLDMFQRKYVVLYHVRNQDIVRKAIDICINMFTSN